MEGEPPCVGRIVRSADDRDWNGRHREQLSGQKYSSKTVRLKGKPCLLPLQLTAPLREDRRGRQHGRQRVRRIRQ